MVSFCTGKTQVSQLDTFTVTELGLHSISQLALVYPALAAGYEAKFEHILIVHLNCLMVAQIQILFELKQFAQL